MKTIVKATEFTGHKMNMADAIGFIVRDYEGLPISTHRKAWRAFEAAKKQASNGATAYAIIGDESKEIHLVKGDIPDGYLPLSDRFIMDGIQYYLNNSKSHYLKAESRFGNGQLASYMECLVVKA